MTATHWITFAFGWGGACAYLQWEKENQGRRLIISLASTLLATLFVVNWIAGEVQ